MDFSTGTGRRERAESIVPMINVVFLLLVFFLMTATMAPPEPFPIDAPASVEGAETRLGEPLQVSAAGDLAWGAYRDDAALAAIGRAWAEAPGAPPLVIKADRGVEGAAVARLLAALAEAGVERSALVTGSVR